MPISNTELKALWLLAEIFDIFPHDVGTEIKLLVLKSIFLAQVTRLLVPSLESRDMWLCKFNESIFIAAQVWPFPKILNFIHATLE